MTRKIIIRHEGPRPKEVPAAYLNRVLTLDVDAGSRLWFNQELTSGPTAFEAVPTGAFEADDVGDQVEVYRLT